MVEYFSKVAEGISIPLVLQDHPASTQVSMSVPLLARLVTEIPSIACVKLESLPSPPKIAQLRGMIRDDCTILTGLGALYGGFDLSAGSDGFMTVRFRACASSPCTRLRKRWGLQGFAFPEALSAMVEATVAGEGGEATRIYSHWLPLIVFEQQPGVSVRKEVYRLRGLLDCNIPRHPANPIGERRPRLGQRGGAADRRIVAAAQRRRRRTC